MGIQPTHAPCPEMLPTSEGGHPQPTLGTARQPANTLLKACSLMKGPCRANTCPL